MLAVVSKAPKTPFLPMTMRNMYSFLICESLISAARAIVDRRN